MNNKQYLILLIALTAFMSGCVATEVGGKETVGENVAVVENLPMDLPIRREELKLGNIELGISEKEFNHLAASSFLHEIVSEENEPEFIEKECAYSNGLKATFTDFHDGRGFILFRLETSSKEYATVRGLSVGDDVRKIYELYGAPLWEIFNGEFYYGTETGDYMQLAIMTEDGKVLRIATWLLM
ncbi:MAG: hypothetical protein FWG42_11120 [Clostridiales bacterium]|nr:hypothetical protein [Clostridiales bacterium]